MKIEYLTLGWDEIENYCIELAKRIKRDGVKFDYILAISRGGLIPARLISDYLDLDILVTRIKFYTSIGKTSRRPVVLYFPEDVYKKRILIVDDIADTGESILKAIEELKKRNVNFYKVATLLKKPWSKITPDYYVKETDRWVVFPWEKIETIRSIRNKTKNEEEIYKELEKAGLKSYFRKNLDLV